MNKSISTFLLLAFTAIVMFGLVGYLFTELQDTNQNHQKVIHVEID
ncbi:hypothetical protein [Gracilibacillus sp. YIM 98692]|nr:hypothetical protein [Gracilibacillus sp. YIM 98692]